MKDYKDWMPIKANINNTPRKPTFNEGDVFWVCIGENVGFEQDGKGIKFARPVVIVVKYNANLFLGLPLTSAGKTGKYYHSIGLNGRKSVAILSQLRAIDSARISGKRLGTVPPKEFRALKERLKAMIH